MIYIVGSYLLGSIPHLKLLAWLRHIKLEGDYHQELYYRAGKIYGVLGVIGEFIKGAAPVLVGKALDFDIGIITAAGLAAVCGQMWPVFSLFDGEKGNSIALAMMMALTPFATLIGMVPVIISLIFRTVPRLMNKSGNSGSKGIVGGQYSNSLPVGMALCFLVIPFAAWWLGEPWQIVWGGFALFFLMIIVRRLTAGLRVDLASGADVKKIIHLRLLYDRSTVAWRQDSAH